jgi:hypothetical protein
MALHDKQQFLRALEREFEEEYPVDGEFEEEVGGSVLPPASSRLLQSSRFADDPELQAIAAGQLRLGRPNDPQYPAPIRSQGVGVGKVQQALIDLGSFLPSGADGRYGQETYNAVFSYKQQFNIRTPGGYLDGIVGPETIAHLDSRFPAAPQEVECSGWESDPQSFSKAAAEHYLRRIWQPGFRVNTITCMAPAPNWMCNVSVGTGAGTIELIVQLAPEDKLVRVERVSDPKAHMVCFYGYRCLFTGQLQLTDSTCPSF